MIEMSRDFALPSLNISDQSLLQIKSNGQIQVDINGLGLRRRWENDPHPYMFFNQDGFTFTFFGFYVNIFGHLFDPISNRRVFSNINLDRQVLLGIKSQSIGEDKNILSEKVGNMSKNEKIFKLLRLMGAEGTNNDINKVVDPDETYELTMDNLLKMLAIYMRFRADIPVLIMGETGVGKTRLCKYLCELQINQNEKINNFYIVRVHGGTTSEDIFKHVRNAEELAARNFAQNPHVFTVLFFDEANSTEAIGSIKEVMCDRRVDGVELRRNTNLRIVAACNPYKKHSDDTIKKFEKSGLGFYEETDGTLEMLGDLPMRHLVYRVQPLPCAMLPLIWDFGSLNDDIERVYIQQIVKEKLQFDSFSESLVSLLIETLSVSQKFMREQQNECIYVSLRDIQRVLKVFSWFYHNGKDILNKLKEKITKKLENNIVCAFYNMNNQAQSKTASLSSSLHSISNSASNLEIKKSLDTLISLEDSDDYQNDTNDQIESCENIEQACSKSFEDKNLNHEFYYSLILSLNMCYHVSLKDDKSRIEYIEKVVKCFNIPTIDINYVKNIIDKCYEVILDEFKLPQAIARNQALKENIFMMLLCIELKIPLFVIGKPGSSKSLAKSLIAQKMQTKELLISGVLKNFKEMHLITFQCSPLTSSDMILSAFKQSANYQEAKKDELDTFTSVVVLDEIGLAEASKSMPLKILHPLLEEGLFLDQNNDKNSNSQCEEWNKVGFMGISNWNLDPAKMNRGLLLNRTAPDEKELKDTFIGICVVDSWELKFLEENKLIDPLSEAYLDVCNEAQKRNREFFGLRDFYSLVKMIYWHLKKSKPDSFSDASFIEKAIRRNFSGLLDLDPIEIFKRSFEKHKLTIDLDNLTNYFDLIKEAFFLKSTEEENRYLLLLSNNENSIELIFNIFEKEKFDLNDVQLIYGSSFPNDQNYSQICRNIHKIKLSMELGKTVVLFNLEHLYESLYDALNQFYYKWNDNERLVDLGLGTQRVKCLVHEKFRLIIVADTKTVYDSKKFPIPLINRLEKHILSSDLMLTQETKQVRDRISDWCKQVITLSEKYSNQNKKTSNKFKFEDIFVGYSSDTISTLVLKFFSHQTNVYSCFEECIQYLIQCATSDGIFRLIESTQEEKIAFDNMCYNLFNSSPKNSLDHQSSNSDEQSEFLNLENTDSTMTPINLEYIIDTYFKDYSHYSFSRFLENYLKKTSKSNSNLIQLTTHSNLLSNSELKKLTKSFESFKFSFKMLLEYNTNQQLTDDLRKFFEEDKAVVKKKIMILQCYSGNLYQELLSCTRFTIDDEFNKMKQANINHSNYYVFLVIKIPRVLGGCFTGFQINKWFCFHIDDLENNTLIESPLSYMNKSMSDVFKSENENETFIDFLRSNIYIACSKIISKSDRSITRIDLMKSILSSNQIASSILNYISHLQEEKEKKLSTSAISKQWIFYAAKMNNITISGTLKKSCEMLIKERMTHLLSAIIALLDTNNNLDTFNGRWKEFWIRFFLNNRLFKFEYETLIKEDNQNQNNQFKCINTNANEKLNLRLPFSWLIKNELDKLININDNSANLESVFSTTELYKFLVSELSDRKIFDDFYNAYVDDFVILSTEKPFINSKHFELVKNRLFAYCKTNHSNQASVESLLYMHISFKELKDEFDLFFKFVSIDLTVLVEGMQKVVDCLWEWAEFTNKLQQKYSSEFKFKDFSLNTASALVFRFYRNRERSFDCFQESINEVIRNFELKSFFEIIMDKEKENNEYSELLNNIKSRLAYSNKDEEENLNLEDNLLNKIDSNQSNLNLCSIAAQHVCDGLKEAKTTNKNSNWEVWFSKAKKYSNLIEIYLNLNKTQNDDDYKSVWQRVIIMKYFIENVCFDDEIMYRSCSIFWNKIKDLTDIRQKKCYDIFFKFLELTFKSVKSRHEKTDESCSYCKENDNTNIWYLNGCKKRCILCANDKDESVCKGCGDHLKAPLKIETVPKKPSQLKLYKSKTTFYYMNVLNKLILNKSNILYEDRTLVDDEVIDSIIETLFRPQKNSIFNIGGAIKSTLFQILFNDKKSNIEKFMKKFFEQAGSNNNDTRSFLELIYIYSVEDNFYLKTNTNNVDARTKFEMGNSVKLLNEINLMGASDTQNLLNKLDTIAKIRFIIISLANCIFRMFETNLNIKYFEKFILEIKNLFAIENLGLRIKFFLIKYLFRTFGRSFLLKLKDFDNLKWILPSEAFNENTSDSFLVLGHFYKNTRDKLSDYFETGNLLQITELDTVVTREIFLSNLNLAFFSVINSRNDLNQIKLVALSNLIGNLANNSKVTADLKLIYTSIANGRFNNLYSLNKNIIQLLLHIRIAITTFEVFKPFKKLLKDPKQFKKSFFPSMPHDEDYELFTNLNKIQAANIKYGKQKINEDFKRLKAYQCRNGHIYYIGECGRANELATCPTCKVPIGGQNHQNVDANGVGFSATPLTPKEEHAYCSVSALKRGNNPTSIRNMGFLNSTILRIILDCVLFMSSIDYRLDVCDLLTVEKNDNPTEFFSRQILKDVNILTNFLQHSIDDSLLLIHFFLSQIQISGQQAKIYKFLKTKEERNEYEKELCDKYLNQIIANNQDKIINNMANIINKESDQDQLTRIAFDSISLTDNSESQFLGDKKYWFYRKQISVESMIKSFNLLQNELKQTNYKILNEFISKIYHLEALRYLPDISKMLHVLGRQFDSQITRSYAKNKNMSEFLDKQSEDSELKKVVENGIASFLECWNLLRDDLKSNHVFDKETITLSDLLPDYCKNGRKINILLIFLINLQNDFVGFFNDNYKVSCCKPDKISLSSVTNNNCFSFSIQKEIYNLCLACSNYVNFDIGKDMILEYDFEKIQTTISSVYLEPCCYIDPKSIIQNKYLEDINFRKFEELNLKVKQMELSFEMKEKIILNYKQANELDEIIRLIGIVIDFVILSGCSAEETINNYIYNILKIKRTEDTINKNINGLKMTYLVSLWKILNFRRSFLLTLHGQDAFDKLNEKFKINKNNVTDLANLLNYVCKEKKFVNTVNLFYLLNFLNDLIIELEQENELEEISLKSSYDFSVYIREKLQEEQTIKLNEYNFDGFKMENIYEIWQILIRKYTSIKF